MWQNSKSVWGQIMFHSTIYTVYTYIYCIYHEAEPNISCYCLYNTLYTKRNITFYSDVKTRDTGWMGSCEWHSGELEKRINCEHFLTVKLYLCSVLSMLIPRASTPVTLQFDAVRSIKSAARSVDEYHMILTSTSFIRFQSTLSSCRKWAPYKMTCSPFLI